MIELLNLKGEFEQLRRPLQQAVLDVLSSGRYVLGPRVSELEQVLSLRFGHAHVLGVASGTDALLLALEALDIGPGDEVITTPFSFFAGVEAILRVGAKPVFVDIEADTFNINPQQLEVALTAQTKAILPVHLFGQCADMGPIMELAHCHGLYVIEDACQAFGAVYRGTPAGIMGDVGCFSFYPTKPLGAFGDGGLVVTRDRDLMEKISLLRNHGSKQTYLHEQVGINSRLDELQAAVLLVKLQVVDKWIERRQNIARQYSQALAGAYQTPAVQADRNHVFCLYSIQHPNRDAIRALLNQSDIQTQVYYPLSLHLQPAMHSMWQAGDFPVSEAVSQRIFSIPMHPMMRDDEVNYVIEILLEAAAGD